MKNRFVPVLVSVALLLSLSVTAHKQKVFALEIAGTTPTAFPEPVMSFDEGATINDLQIVTDDQLKKIPLSAFYQFPVDRDQFKGVSTKFSGYHPGVDFRAEINSPIKPIQAGTVVTVGAEKGGYGNYVIVKHTNGIHSLYAHMTKVKVKLGDAVETSTVIGTIGITGHATGPHLHFEMRTNTGYINPAKVFAEVNAPALGKNMASAGSTKTSVTN